MLTGNPLHIVRTTMDPEGTLTAFTSVAWDHHSPHPRFATGSVDGALVIWTSEPERQQHSGQTVLGSQPDHDVFSTSPTTIHRAIPEETAVVHREAGIGLGLDISRAESMGGTPGGSRKASKA